jgi:hypothetical protein
MGKREFTTYLRSAHVFAQGDEGRDAEIEFRRIAIAMRRKLDESSAGKLSNAVNAQFLYGFIVPPPPARWLKNSHVPAMFPDVT